MQEIPKIGKVYDCYHDGKVKESRRSEIKITKIIPFAELQDIDIYSQWYEDIEDCHWLYLKETDYFVFGKSDDAEHIFVRSKHGWYSIGDSNYQLDITNNFKNQEWYSKPIYAR